MKRMFKFAIFTLAVLLSIPFVYHIVTAQTTVIGGDGGGSGSTGATGPSGPSGPTGPTGPSLLITSGTAVLGTSEIASEACATAVTETATGAVAGDTITFTPTSDITTVTGYAPVIEGGLSIYPYAGTDNVNFKVCNPTLDPITPGAVTLAWMVYDTTS